MAYSSNIQVHRPNPWDLSQGEDNRLDYTWFFMRSDRSKKPGDNRPSHHAALGSPFAQPHSRLSATRKKKKKKEKEKENSEAKNKNKNKT
jgi:hypothetical protein